MNARGTVFVALVLASVTRVASAEEGVRYVVQRGDTCSAISKRFYGDSGLVRLIHEANGMTSPPPHSLAPGRVLLIPPKPGVVPSGPDARLSAVKNRVHIRDPEPRPGHVDDPLFRGNRVATEAVSSAAVTFRDETQVRLGERSLIVILGDVRAAASRPVIETTLVTGDLRAFMSKKSGARANVATDGAAVTIIEGEAKVSADERKTTRVAVYDGSSTITAVKVRREVPTGYGSKADLGKPPTTPRPLPPPPLWSVVSPAVLVDAPGGPPPFVASYDLPAGSAAASSWHVQVARDPAFLDVVVDETVPRDIGRLEAKAPGPGRYYARVSAFDDDRFEGPFGRAVAFGVVHVARIAEGATDRVTVSPLGLFCHRVGNSALQRVTSDVVVKRGEPVLLRCGATADQPTTLVRVD